MFLAFRSCCRWQPAQLVSSAHAEKFHLTLVNRFIRRYCESHHFTTCVLWLLDQAVYVCSCVFTVELKRHVCSPAVQSSDGSAHGPAFV